MIFDPIERKNEITIFTEKKICNSGRNTLIEVTAPERQNVRALRQVFGNSWDSLCAQVCGSFWSMHHEK